MQIFSIFLVISKNKENEEKKNNNTNNIKSKGILGINMKKGE